MEKEQPTIKIAYDKFYIEPGLLRHCENPDIELPFDRMEASVLKMTALPVRRFFYDAERKCIAEIGELQGRMPETVQYIEIPERVIGGKGAASAVNPMSKIEGQLYDEGEQFSGRILPKIDLFGDEFIVDTLNLELVDLMNRDNRISFEDIHVIEGKDEKMFLEYNIQTRNIAQLNDDQDAMVIKFLPPMSEMDPVAWMLLLKPEERTRLREDVKPKEATAQPAKRSKGMRM